MQTTELQRIDPRLDVDVQQFYEEAKKLLDYANARTITTLEETKLATDDLALISKVKKAMEQKRKDYLLPFQEHVKEVNEIYKTLMQPIDQADYVTRQKVLSYQREQARIKAEQDEINRLRMEAANKEAALNNGEIKESVNLIDVVDVPKKVYSDTGTLGTSKVWKFEIEDLSKIPLDYLEPDMVKIGKVIRAGVKIPGVKSWQEDSLRITNHNSREA
jgi:hypothetical protein